MVSKMCADKVFLLVLFYIDTLKRVAMTLKESSPFSLWSPSSSSSSSGVRNSDDGGGGKPLHDYKATIRCDKSDIYVRINEYKKKPYMHIRKVLKGTGKSTSLSLDIREFYDLFGNGELFNKEFENALDKIKAEYGNQVLEGEEDDTTNYVVIPRSQRTREIEEAQKQMKEKMKQEEEDFREYKRMKKLRERGERQKANTQE